MVCNEKPINNISLQAEPDFVVLLYINGREVPFVLDTYSHYREDFFLICGVEAVGPQEC